MTKILNFALKIKGGGREGGTCEVLRPCHPSKIWNVHQSKVESIQLKVNLIYFNFINAWAVVIEPMITPPQEHYTTVEDVTFTLLSLKK